MYEISSCVQLPGRSVSSAPEALTVEEQRLSTEHWTESEIRINRAKFQVLLD